MPLGIVSVLTLGIFREPLGIGGLPASVGLFGTSGGSFGLLSFDRAERLSLPASACPSAGCVFAISFLLAADCFLASLAVSSFLAFSVSVFAVSVDPFSAAVGEGWAT